MAKSMIILMLALVSAVHSQTVFPGGCPDVEVVENFNASGYLGTWYETQRYEAIFELASKCSSATYSLNDNGTVHVLNKDVNSLTGESHVIEGIATFQGAVTEAKLNVVFPSRSNDVAEYLVLGTDYDSYAAVFSCTDFGLFSARFAWLLTRERTNTDAAVQAARAVFKSQGINTDPLDAVDQNNCSNF